MGTVVMSSVVLSDSKRDYNVNEQQALRFGRSYTFDPSHLNLRFGKRAYESDPMEYANTRLGKRSSSVLDLLDDDQRRKKAAPAAVYVPLNLADDLALRFGK
ncbi:unnamed protein product [Gongylonema pulchrum]|uniref:TonB-dependent receptor n=1 Tax=Gongylonema pulchrum TaxID=637853 RepID=A0A183E744_9BILA|nr:unnamed protein product [Gongylonema pulchrum]